MTQEEKTIKLAEAAGFTDIMLPMGFHQQMSDEKSKECGGRWRFEIPNYFEDLNAVHELQAKLTNDQQFEFVYNLNEVLEFVPLSSPASYKEVVLFAFTNATAAERCEAIGKTLGLW